MLEAEESHRPDTAGKDGERDYTNEALASLNQPKLKEITIQGQVRRNCRYFIISFQQFTATFAVSQKACLGSLVFEFSTPWIELYCSYY